MGWFHWRRDLDLRPLSELHDEFAARPGAQSKLDNAEAELTPATNTEAQPQNPPLHGT